MDNTKEIMWAVYIGTQVACFLLNASRIVQATELCEECLILLSNTAEEKVVDLAYKSIYNLLCQAYFLLNNHTSAIECGKKLLDFLRSLGLRAEEGKATYRQAQFYKLQSKLEEAKGLYKKSLSIMIETGDKKGEAMCYGSLGVVYQSFGEYRKAEEYQRKALAITKQIAHKKGEAACYGNLGGVYESIGKYGKAEEYQRKALVITKEIGDKKEEATCYGNLGIVS